MKEYISRKVVDVKTQGEAFHLVENFDNDPDNQSLYLYDIGTLSKRLISIVKVR